MRRLDLNELKQEYIGKTFSWLTVIDVFRNEHNVITFKCKCRCGNVTCTRKQYILSGHTTSCGCYKNSKEKSAKYIEWCKNNPDKIKEQADKYSQWCKNNPDKVKEIAEKRSKTLEENPAILANASKKQKQFWKDNPDKLTERGKKRSDWAKNNPDKVKAIAEKCSKLWYDNEDMRLSLSNKVSEFYKNHPEMLQCILDKGREWRENNRDKVIELGKARSELYKENPDLLKRLSEANKQYWKDHRDEALLRGSKTAEFYKNNREVILKIAELNSSLNKEKRKQTDIACLLDIVHPLQMDDLISGNIKSSDNILTRCPICGSYSSHTLNNVFIFSKHKLKLDRPPLCENCRLTLTTSQYEQEIADYISTFYSGELVRNSRSIISPLELDLFYPEKRIAIEFNGDYWHDENHKSRDYHYNKFKSCKDLGILLVSIFESAWITKKDDIKHYLNDLFNDVENSLSFSDDKLWMNNNYPTISCKCTDEVIEESFTHKDALVYTCGYSKIIK